MLDVREQKSKYSRTTLRKLTSDVYKTCETGRKCFKSK